MRNVTEALQGFMYSTLRRAGVSISFDQIEALQGDCSALAKAIEDLAEAKAVKLAEKLQGRVADAFDKMAKEIDAMEAKVKDLEARIDEVDEMASTEP